MVFANLDEEDKEAFFELLDEYFATRPELAETLQLTRTGLRIDSTSNSNQNVIKKSIPPSRAPLPSPASSTTSTRPPPSTLGKPPAIPRRVTTPTANSVSEDGNGSDSPILARSSPAPSVNSNQDFSNEISSTVGRIAAARLAFNNNSSNVNNTNSNDNNSNARPMPPPPRRMASTSSDVSAGKRTSLAVPPRPSIPPKQPKPLRESSNKSDTRPSWVKANNDDDNDNEIESPALVTPSSLRASRQNSLAASTPTITTTFPPPPRRTVAPPPRRLFNRHSPKPESEPEEVPQHEEEEEEEEEPEEGAEGEWAEVIYDYTSSDPNDLELKEGQHVLIKERTSDDWWTAELDKKTGLIPAAYVKVL